MEKMALDAATARRIDENGFLHVSGNRISKATVNPYYGREIPGWKDLGLDPQKIYQGFRAPEELEKAAPTFAGIPLQAYHHPDSADIPQTDHRVGTIGTDVSFQAPYLVASLTVWNADAIEQIENGTMRELSCAYRYEPEFTPGEWQGQRYDFIMRNIRGNHVALVEEGRAGSDVIVADAQINTEPSEEENDMSKNPLKALAQDGDPAVEQKEVDLAQAIIDLHKRDPMTGEIVDVAEDEDKLAKVKQLVSMLEIAPEQKKQLADALKDLAYSKATGESKAAEKTDATEEAKGEDAECQAKDSETSAEQKAFAEGVEYGEEKEKEEPEKLDREHEREGEEKHLAEDAAAIRREALKLAREELKALTAAARKVRPICGEVDPFAFDSASGIYAHALNHAGRDPKKYSAAAYEGIVDVLLETRTGGNIAQDAKPADAAVFPHLSKY